MKIICSRPEIYTKAQKKCGSGFIVPGLGILLLSLFATGCTFPMNPPPSPREACGKLTITIPHYAAWVEKYLPKDETPRGTGFPGARAAGSRAFAQADGVMIEVEDASGNDAVPPVAQYWPSYSDHAGSLDVVSNIPVGIYTVRISIYNGNVSWDDPVVAGEAVDVEIQENVVTPLHIVCFPVDPQTITADSGPWTDPLEAWAEKWYSTNMTAGQTYYITTNMAAAVFGQDGKYLTDGSSIMYTPESSGTVYICTLNDSGADEVELNVVTLPPVTYIPLSADGSWISGSVDYSGEEVWYEADVTGGQSYLLSWDDSFQGSGNCSLDVKVTAYHAGTPEMYFSEQDSGWDTPPAISVPDDESKIYIKVEAYDGNGTGSFDLMLVPSGT